MDEAAVIPALLNRRMRLACDFIHPDAEATLDFALCPLAVLRQRLKGDLGFGDGVIRLFMTPHIAGTTKQMLLTMLVEIVDKLADHFDILRCTQRDMDSVVL